ELPVNQDLYPLACNLVTASRVRERDRAVQEVGLRGLLYPGIACQRDVDGIWRLWSGHGLCAPSTCYDDATRTRRRRRPLLIPCERGFVLPAVSCRLNDTEISGFVVTAVACCGRGRNAG